jgi:hypothetical protein
MLIRQTEPVQEKKEMSEEEKAIRKLAAEFMKSGFKSPTACQLMARDILGQKDKRNIPNSITKRKEANKEAKAKFEADAKARQAASEARRKAKKT